MQAPFSLSVFETVVSNTNACTRLVKFQFSKHSNTADEISRPVPFDRFDTLNDCPVPRAMVIMNNLSTDFPVTLSNNFMFHSELKHFPHLVHGRFFLLSFHTTLDVKSWFFVWVCDLRYIH